jgi:hypothetical protein
VCSESGGYHQSNRVFKTSFNPANLLASTPVLT